MKEELTADLRWLTLQVGRPAAEVALDLTRRWQNDPARLLRKPSKGSSKRPNGRVLRVLRPIERGVLIIYPIVRPTVIKARNGEIPKPTGLKPEDDPLIGIALSFPTSDTATGVEYMANQVWGTVMEDDEAYED